VKFTPAGGSVCVDAKHSDERGILITIADTGIGMKPEDIPAALTPFRQLEEQLIPNLTDPDRW
jgi:two-component system, cell cycle sensor histidine kinase PleC